MLGLVVSLLESTRLSEKKLVIAGFSQGSWVATDIALHVRFSIILFFLLTESPLLIEFCLLIEKIIQKHTHSFLRLLEDFVCFLELT